MSSDSFSSHWGSSFAPRMSPEAVAEQQLEAPSHPPVSRSHSPQLPPLSALFLYPNNSQSHQGPTPASSPMCDFETNQAGLSPDRPPFDRPLPPLNLKPQEPSSPHRSSSYPPPPAPPPPPRANSRIEITDLVTPTRHNSYERNVSDASTTCSDTRSRNFECTVCTKRFLRKQDLSRHHATHTRVKSHVCFGCGSGFARQDALQRHIKSCLFTKIGF